MSTRPGGEKKDLTGALRSALASLREPGGRPIAAAAATLPPVAPGGAPAPVLARPVPGPVPGPVAAPASWAPGPTPAGRILNATGRIFDRALGSPPLAAEARRAFDEAASRPAAPPDAALEALLRALTGAEAALVLADAGLALHAAVAAHAAPGGEIVVSRGDLFEQESGLRIPDLVTEAGGQLFEIGSIDRTDVSEFADAVTPATRMFLQLHRPVRLAGATSPHFAALAALARTQRVLSVHALGPGGLETEGETPGLSALLAAGADLVVAPADRLLGGPRAGLVLGRTPAVAAVARLALARASALDGRLRACLAATLALHAQASEAAERIPALRLLGQDRLLLAERAARLAGLLGLGEHAVVPTRPLPGAGVRLDRPPASFAVALPAADEEARRARLAARPVPVATHAAGGRTLLDVLALADAELGEVADAVRAAG